jgi:hypothetical protein
MQKTKYKARFVNIRPFDKQSKEVISLFVSEKYKSLNSCLSIFYVFQIELLCERLKETTIKHCVKTYMG